MLGGTVKQHFERFEKGVAKINHAIKAARDEMKNGDCMIGGVMLHGVTEAFGELDTDLYWIEVDFSVTPETKRLAREERESLRQQMGDLIREWRLTCACDRRTEASKKSSREVAPEDVLAQRTEIAKRTEPRRVAHTPAPARAAVIPDELALGIAYEAAIDAGLSQEVAEVMAEALAGQTPRDVSEDEYRRLIVGKIDASVKKAEAGAKCPVVKDPATGKPKPTRTTITVRKTGKGVKLCAKCEAAGVKSTMRELPSRNPASRIWECPTCIDREEEEKPDKSGGDGGAKMSGLFGLGAKRYATPGTPGFIATFFLSVREEAGLRSPTQAELDKLVEMFALYFYSRVRGANPAVARTAFERYRKELVDKYPMWDLARNWTQDVWADLERQAAAWWEDHEDDEAIYAPERWHARTGRRTEREVTPGTFVETINPLTKRERREEPARTPSVGRGEATMLIFGGQIVETFHGEDVEVRARRRISTLTTLPMYAAREKEPELTQFAIVRATELLVCPRCRGVWPPRLPTGDPRVFCPACTPQRPWLPEKARTPAEARTSIRVSEKVQEEFPATKPVRAQGMMVRLIKWVRR